MILTDACLQLQHDIANIQYDSAWASLQGAQSKAAAPKLKLLASTTSATAPTVSHTSQLRCRNLRTLSPARVIMYACPDMVCTPEDKVRPGSQSSVSLLYKIETRLFNNIRSSWLEPVLRLHQFHNSWLLKCPAEVLPMS